MADALCAVPALPAEPPMRGKLWVPTPGRARNDSELRMEAILIRMGIAHGYEDRFFTFGDPTMPSPNDEGVAPDYRVMESSFYAEQWIEVTVAKNKNILRRKRQKIAKALHKWGVRILLVDEPLLAAMEVDPSQLTRRLLPAFQADRCPLPEISTSSPWLHLAATS